MIVALFTNYWQITNAKYREDEYYTWGIWWSCRKIRVSWIERQYDSYCSTINNKEYSWIIAGKLI
jgi:hypothetical protein